MSSGGRWDSGGPVQDFEDGQKMVDRNANKMTRAIDTIIDNYDQINKDSERREIEEAISLLQECGYVGFRETAREYLPYSRSKDVLERGELTSIEVDREVTYGYPTVGMDTKIDSSAEEPSFNTMYTIQLEVVVNE